MKNKVTEILLNLRRLRTSKTDKFMAIYRLSEEMYGKRERAKLSLLNLIKKNWYLTRQ
jgi:hypothetical protein